MQVQHILFPTDFSDLARAAELHVSRFADHFNARVTVLHIIEFPTALYGMPPECFFDTRDIDILQEEGRKKIDGTFPGLNCAREVKFGEPASVITSFADANSVDLIMMPTHGYGPFRRALIGSVTAKVLHDTKCPVWTMAHTEAAEPELPSGVARMICAVDLVPETVGVIRQAGELAQSFGAQLWLGHAVPKVHTISEEYLGEKVNWALDLQNFYADHAREEIGKLQEEAGTNFNLCIDAGTVAEVIAGIARKHRADLLVTGRGAIEHFLGTVRSHAYPIIQESPCPVLSL